MNKESGTVDSREVLEYIRTICEDSIIRDSELEMCNRAIDLALKSIDDCGLLRTQLEIAEQTIKLNEWVSVNDRLPNEDEMYYNGVRDYNDDTFRTSSDKVLAQDENGEIYCGYFMSSCWHHEYNGEGRIENEYTRYGEACWEFGVDDGKELIASIGTNIKIIAWKPLPKPYERKE